MVTLDPLLALPGEKRARRGLPGEPTLNTAPDRAGQLILVGRRGESLCLLRIGDKTGLDKDGGYVSGFQHRKRCLLNLPLV